MFKLDNKIIFIKISMTNNHPQDNFRDSILALLFTATCIDPAKMFLKCV